MKERPPGHEHEDPFYNRDEQIGQVHLWDQDWALRLLAHVGDEEYARHHGEEIIELAKPYILRPDYRLTIQLNQEPDPSGHVGKVVGTDWPGMRHQPIGTAQAWYYPLERTVVLWECFLETRYAREQPHDDPNHGALWTGFGTFLQREFPQAHTMVTTHAEPMYEHEDYQAFLAKQGYRPMGVRAWGKRIAGAGPGEVKT